MVGRFCKIARPAVFLNGVNDGKIFSEETPFDTIFIAHIFDHNFCLDSGTSRRFYDHLFRNLGRIRLIVGCRAVKCDAGILWFGSTNAYTVHPMAWKTSSRRYGSVVVIHASQ